MSLESLLNGIKLVKRYTWDLADEFALRQYTKLTKKWEGMGTSRYTLAHIFNLSGQGSNYFAVGVVAKYSPVEYMPVSKYQAATLFLNLWLLQITDFGRNILEPDIKKEISEDGTVAKDGILGPSILIEFPIYVMYAFKKLADIIRLPSLSVGLTFMGKGAFELFDYFKNANPESLNHAMWDLSFGYGFVGNASSMYIKNANPKLLDKQPIWKEALGFVKEKLTIAPQPVPQPSPAQSSFISNEYIQV